MVDHGAKERRNMKISKDLNDALEMVSKEVDSWPAWKRSIDSRDLKKLTEASENRESSNDARTSEQKPPLSARAARA
jgi:hypothetical protein